MALILRVSGQFPRPAVTFDSSALTPTEDAKHVADLSSLSVADLADRIAIVRDNIRQITEQATAQSGAADEERNAERLSIQNEELDQLLAEQARRQGR